MEVELKRKPWVCRDCGIVMQMHVTGDFCICPICKTEVWFVFCDDEIKQVKEAFENNTYVSRSLPPGYRVPPGGSRKGKNRSKTEQMKKQSPQKLFEKMFKQT